MINTQEAYILHLIKNVKEEIILIKQEFKDNKLIEKDYNLLSQRFYGQLDVLYMIITGHDNPQSKFSILNKKYKK